MHEPKLNPIDRIILETLIFRLKMTFAAYRRRYKKMLDRIYINDNGEICYSITFNTYQDEVIEYKGRVNGLIDDIQMIRSGSSEKDILYSERRT